MPGQERGSKPRIIPVEVEKIGETGEYRENCAVVGVFRLRHHLGYEHSTLPDHERKLQKSTENDMHETLAVLQRWLWEKKHLRTVEF
jgi:hypothetical protein